ncbi:MAG: class I SAM-dependent methyltransferase [Xanthomonadales bacterium]|jgi:ubiquinone/menaquinone biosynthesis C-methylase UbiE|nr:class I SAM-dependent methyltransferase [Xanthomonadales bacterium]
MNPWSLFWRQGHSTTFGDYFKQGYVGAVADWWQSKLDGLPENATVMELGCGNCSLLPAMIASGVKGKYIGVDIAEVSPSPVAQQGLAESGIELVLHSATPAEKVPQPDASADLVASVFGIEYSDMERSVPEAARVLKPGGRFCSLVHHDNSLITGMSRRAISEFSSDDLRKVIESLTMISTERDRIVNLSGLKSSYKAEKGRKTINSLAQKYLSDTNLETMNATMFEVMTQALKFFKMMGASSQQRRDFIAWLEAEQRASHERFQQMVSVAFDAEGIEALQAMFEAAGFQDLKTEVIHSDKDILAWGLQADKMQERL